LQRRPFGSGSPPGVDRPGFHDRMDDCSTVHGKAQRSRGSFLSDPTDAVRDIHVLGPYNSPAEPTYRHPALGRQNPPIWTNTRTNPCKILVIPVGGHHGRRHLSGERSQPPHSVDEQP
jgi:hypothetical protein